MLETAEGETPSFQIRVKAIDFKSEKELTYISEAFDRGDPFVVFRFGEEGMVCFQANPEVISQVTLLRADRAIKPPAEVFNRVNFLKGLLMQGTLQNGNDISVNIHFVNP